MADIVFIAIALAFFALCALYVRWCDRIIGPDVFVAETLLGARASFSLDRYLPMTSYGKDRGTAITCLPTIGSRNGT